MATDDRLTREIARAIEPYRELLERFVSGDLSPAEFEERYLPIYLGDDSESPDDVFDVVDRFFAEVDSLVINPSLRDQVYRPVTPTELKARAAELLRAAGRPVEAPAP